MTVLMAFLKSFLISSILFSALILKDTSLFFHFAALSFHHLLISLTFCFAFNFKLLALSLHPAVLLFHHSRTSLAFCFALNLKSLTLSLQSADTSFHLALIWSRVVSILDFSFASASRALSLIAFQPDLMPSHKSFAFVPK